MKNILGLLSLILILSCSSDDAVLEDYRNNNNVVVPPSNPSGSYSFYHDSQERIYHYYQPSSLPDNAALIFILHGYRADAKDFMELLPMKELAEEQGFAVVYPQGLNDDSGQIHWNADLDISNVDDVGFLSELAIHLQETHNLNPERTFISGYSNGGFMSYEMILKKPDIFKAAASISGTMSLETWNNRSLAKPSSILQVSGGLDYVVPVNGMYSSNGGWGGAPPIIKIMEFWSEFNQADTQEMIEQDKTKITKYINSESGDEVWYYLIENLDHRIPLGGEYNVHAPTLIWDFFSNYQ